MMVPIHTATKAPGRAVATEEINSKVDVCEKANSLLATTTV